MLVIGLNGRLHSGKDTAFEYINSLAYENGLFADRRAFADKLKLSAATALGYEPVDTDEAVAICDWLKEHGEIEIYDSRTNPVKKWITGREYLQKYGAEAHRNVFGSLFWVNALLPEPKFGVDESWKKVQRAHVGSKFPGVDLLVVTDARFENEAQRILDLGGEVWYIDADQRLGPLPEDAHISERPLPMGLITRTVRNNGSIAEFGSALSFAFHEAISR